MCGLRHGPMVAMLSRTVEKGGANNVGTVGPNDLGKALQGPRMAPFPKCFGAGFGKAEIDDRIIGTFREPVHRQAQDIASARHFCRP